MSSTPSRSVLRPVVSAGDRLANSPAAETLRRRIQASLPYGSAETIRDRSGTALRCVRAQLQGEDPLTVKVAVEALALLAPAPALLAVDELLAPGGWAVIPRPGESRDSSGLLALNGALLAALAATQERLGQGLADGVMTTAEAVPLAASLTETVVRAQALLAALAVGQ